MQKTPRRDLWVVSKTGMDPEAFDQAVEVLGHIISEAETPARIALVSEIIDVNRCRVITHPLKVARILRQRGEAPFLFACNKN